MKWDRDYNIDMETAWRLSKSWLHSAIIWRVIDYVISIGAFVLSMLVVYFTVEIGVDKELIVILSSASALLVLGGFALNPTKFIHNYRAAFQILNEAIVENVDENGVVVGDEGIDKIRRAIISGERRIGRTYEIEYDDLIKPNGECADNDS